MSLLGNYKYLTEYAGKKVELVISSQSSNTIDIEKGVIERIVPAGGDNGLFLELDTGVLINVRYIIKITLLD